MAKNTNHARKVEEPKVEEVVQPVEYNLDKLMEQYKTKSNVIRFLTTQGKTRSEIAKFMNIRYQHVRNVLTQPLKQTPEVLKETPAETEPETEKA